MSLVKKIDNGVCRCCAFNGVCYNDCIISLGRPFGKSIYKDQEYMLSMIMFMRKLIIRGAPEGVQSGGAKEGPSQPSSYLRGEGKCVE